MKPGKLIHVILITALVFTILLFAGIQKFAFHGITLNMTTDQVNNIVEGSNCMKFTRQNKVVCGNFRDHALLMDFRNERLYSLIAKADVEDMQKAFDERLVQMKKMYGTPAQLDTGTLVALFREDARAALLRVKESSSGTGLLFYVICQDMECEDIQELMK